MRKVSAAGIGAAAMLTAALTVGMPHAPADSHGTASLGERSELVTGDVVQAWTVGSLKPSTDVISYQPKGTLWEATATDEAVQGSVIPMVSNFNARAANGDSYRVLFGVATAEGVNPATLGQGQKTTGKLYFDVTGADPDTVVYSNSSEELLVWSPSKSAAPAPDSAPRATSAPSTNAAPTTSAESTTSPAADPASESAEPGSEGTPVTEGGEGTPVSEGSEGTPVTEGGEGTPVSEGSPVEEGTPVTEGGEGTQVSEGSPVGEGTPVGEGSQGTPVSEGSEGTPVTGNEGTPVVGQPHGPQSQPNVAPAGNVGTPAN